MKKNISKKLENFNVIIASHIFATGPALDLEEYLKDKTKSLLFIGLPFNFRKDVRPFRRYYDNRQLLIEDFFPWPKFPEIFYYFRDIVFIIYCTLIFKGKVDLFIGSDNFSSFIGLILKRIGKVKEVVFYTIDYMPSRFKNPYLNLFYHYFDKVCLKHCKAIWNVSPVMETAREQYADIKKEKYRPQLLVPLGMWFKRYPKVKFNNKKRYQIIFLGHLLEKQGLDIVIKSLPLIVKKLPKVKLIIIGTGEYENNLKKITKDLNVTRYVDFKGYIDDHKDVEKLLSGSALAIAMYKPDPLSFTNWADPAKLKNYLAAGLPIVLTSVPPIARELEKERCAVISEYNVESLSRVVLKILSNDKTMQEFSRNAIKFSKRFDWNDIFTNALNKTID